MKGQGWMVVKIVGTLTRHTLSDALYHLNPWNRVVWLTGKNGVGHPRSVDRSVGLTWGWLP